MRKIFKCALIWISLSFASLSSASTIYIEPGETYSFDDRNVFCVQKKPVSSEPVILTDCQYWDDFNNKCLHEKTTFSTVGIKCVEECQHWDSFNKKCLYQTTCIFDSGSNTFIRKTCQEFDQFEGKCLRVKEAQIHSD